MFAEDDKMEIIHGHCGFCALPDAYHCVADITRPIPLSHSSVNDFLTCHYLFYLKKALGISRRPEHFSEALKAGVLWETVKQKHIGANPKLSIKEAIEQYQMQEITVVKVRALYHAYKELEIVVEDGFETQAKIDMVHNITLPASSFIPSISIGAESINLWSDRKDQEEDARSWTFPLHVIGFYDRKYPTYFAEDKLSSRPEYYLDPFYIQSQNGTYFLADPNLEYCIQEVAQFPMQRELKNETSLDQLYQRTYDEILSRPSKYFIGYDNKKRMYGKKFYRGEFNLDAIVKKYQQVCIEILAAQWSGNFYRNYKSCNNVLPGISCDFQDICKTNNVSETLYATRKKAAL